jgi:isopenicillin N synthase-like dioxygenase
MNIPLVRGQKVAKLPTISYRALVDNDPAEIINLLSVCVEEGFFYLDMRDNPALLTELEMLQGFIEKWFGQSNDIKQNYARGSYIHGYEFELRT